LTTKKNKPTRAAPPSNRKMRTPAMIHGSFDFFFATGGGKGAEGAAAAGRGAEGTGVGDTVGCGATTSPVVLAGGCSAGGGGGGAAVTGGGGGVGGITGGGDITWGGGAGLEMSAVFGAVVVGPVVGPVLRGSATVAELSMIVAFGSGRSRLVGRSEAAAFKSIDVARIVAFGSKVVCGAISKPPSKVQNFCPSSGNVRLHLGQLFIHATS
jgi:hypothetical protein